MIDRLEKAGRTVLWFALALAVVGYQVQGFLRDRATARVADEAKAEAERTRAELAKDKLKRPSRLTLKSMGNAFQGMEGSLGHVWFTNASPREGIVCAVGTASNGQKSINSLTACQHVEAYESNVKMNVMFAGGDLRELCPTSPCALEVNDAPDFPEPIAVK